MSLPSDCLLATTGIFPAGITPQDHERAAAIPPKWEKRLHAWVKADEQKAFVYVPPKADLEKLFVKLATPPNQLELQETIEGLGVADIEMVADYAGPASGLTRARDYIVNAWPKFTIPGPTGPKILPLSDDDAAEMWSLIQVLDDPSRLLDEIDAFTLTASQAEAFRTCYPDLYAFADQAIRGEMITQQARHPEFAFTWERESVLNTLRGLPPEEPLVQPPPPPKPKADFEVDPEREETQAEVSGAPKGGGK